MEFFSEVCRIPNSLSAIKIEICSHITANWKKISIFLKSQSRRNCLRGNYFERRGRAKNALFWSKFVKCVKTAIFACDAEIFSSKDVFILV